LGNDLYRPDRAAPLVRRTTAIAAISPFTVASANIGFPP
jgi:hypothetical protein